MAQPCRSLWGDTGLRAGHDLRRAIPDAGPAQRLPLRDGQLRGAVAETRDIAALLRAAKAASKDCAWSLSPQQRQAVLYHIDSACARAFRRQALSEHAEDAPPSSCGLPGQNDGTAAPARQAFADILTAPPG